LGEKHTLKRRVDRCADRADPVDRKPDGDRVDIVVEDRRHRLACGHTEFEQAMRQLVCEAGRLGIGESGRPRSRGRPCRHRRDRTREHGVDRVLRQFLHPLSSVLR
jgi:hypothetical protein